MRVLQIFIHMCIYMETDKTINIQTNKYNRVHKTYKIEKRKYFLSFTLFILLSNLDFNHFKFYKEFNLKY